MSFKKQSTKEQLYKEQLYKKRTGNKWDKREMKEIYKDGKKNFKWLLKGAGLVLAMILLIKVLIYFDVRDLFLPLVEQVQKFHRPKLRKKHISNILMLKGKPMILLKLK